MPNRRSAEWYDFVPLPPSGKQPAPDQEGITHAGHLEKEHHSGYIELAMETDSPIHIGSGTLELSEDADQEGGSVVKGMAQVDGRPVIPGSSLKGALRSNYEIITHSCLGAVRTRSTERYSRNPRRSELPQKTINRLPRDLQRKAAASHWSPRITVELDQGEVRQWESCRLSKDGGVEGLCPACAVFGTEGLQGRAWFDDAEVDGDLPQRAPLLIASLYGPRMHRAGELRVVGTGHRAKVQVHHIKGRKVYYHIRLGDVPARGRVPLDYLPEGTKLHTRLHFRNLSPIELGGLVAALGVVPSLDFPFRVGGGKPLGLGYIKPYVQGIYLTDSDDQLLTFDANPTKVADEKIGDWIMAFFQDDTLCYQEGWQRLHKITQRPYVPAERR